MPLFEDLLKRKEAKFGRQHSETQRTVGNLGVNYKDSRRLDEAIPLLEEAHRAAKDSRRSAGSVFHSSTPMRRLAGWPSSRTCSRNNLPKLARPCPRRARNWLACSPDYSRVLLQQSYADAEPLLRECLAIREKSQPDLWSTLNTKSLLGGALLGQKKFADAEPLLLKGYEEMKQREKTIPEQGKIRLPEALDRLIELYTATNKPDDVKKWQAERAKYPEAAPPPGKK